MVDQGDQQQLLGRIEDRRRTVEAFLRTARPRAERLTWVSVISSAVAAALTAGPALGGPGFTESVAGSLRMVDDSHVWRVLCIFAMLVSIVAAISANLSKSKNAEARIISAETCNSELEGLQTLVEFGQVPFTDAVKLYQQYVAKIPFVEGETPTLRVREDRRHG